MRAMILAAGYGTRLWPLTIDRAKPAIPFMGRPLVGYVAEYLARFGFGEIAVNLHHRGESVRASLGDGETTPLMFTGIQILDPRIFEYIPRGVFSHTVTDTFIPAIARGERIAAHVAEGDWYELSTIRRYLETSVALLKREARTFELGE